RNIVFDKQFHKFCKLSKLFQKEKDIWKLYINHVYCSMRASQKRSLILEAAIRRFAHFGLAKTTMSDIASDLAFSKALLYYYYPDKHSLYIAALSHVVEKTLKEVYERIGQ